MKKRRQSLAPDYPVKPEESLTLAAMNLIMQNPHEDHKKSEVHLIRMWAEFKKENPGLFLKRYLEEENAMEQRRVQYERDLVVWKRDNQNKKKIDDGEAACRRLLEKLLKDVP